MWADPHAGFDQQRQDREQAASDLLRTPDGEREGEASAAILAMQAHDLVHDGARRAVQEAFAATIEGRITAITRAHSLLTAHGAASVGTLRDIIETELAPYRGRNLRIEGPDVVLTPKAGLSIAMAIHELASNAVKYGSLSDTKGRLAISWTVKTGPEPRLRLNWGESGGPCVAGPPVRSGFGTTLIERSMRHEWDAEVDRTFAESGVVCIIDLPLTPAVGELRSQSEGG